MVLVEAKVIDFHLKCCIVEQKCRNNISGSTLHSYNRIVKKFLIAGGSLSRKARGWKDDPRQAERAGRELHGCLNSSADLGTGGALSGTAV